MRRTTTEQPHQRAHQHRPHQNPYFRNRQVRRGIACALPRRTQDPSDAGTIATPFVAAAPLSDPGYRISQLDPLDPTYQNSPTRPLLRLLAPPLLPQQPSPRPDFSLISIQRL